MRGIASVLFASSCVSPASRALEDTGTVHPSVRIEATFPVTVSTVTYGQGLRHTEWGGTETEVDDLQLDLYLPEGAPSPRPAIVIIHGGGFVGGSRSGEPFAETAEFFAARGWVATSIDYRLAEARGTLSPPWAHLVRAALPPAGQAQAAALYPAARDAKAAVRWLHANAEIHGVSTEHITAWGGSAGAFLAVVLGVTDPEDFTTEIDVATDPTLASTHLDQPSRVHTIVDHWGGNAHLKALQAIDGRSRFDTDDAPILIVHGDADPTVPFAAAEALRDAYQRTGVPFAFHRLEDVGHGTWDATVNGLTLHELARDFIIEQQGLDVVE